MPAALLQATDRSQLDSFLGDCPDAEKYGVTIVPETNYVSDEQIDMLIDMMSDKLNDEEEGRSSLVKDCDDEEHQDVKNQDAYLVKLRVLVVLLRQAKTPVA